LNAPFTSARRPLIVHVVRQFLPNRGGLEDVVYNLCRELLAKGFAVRVVTLDRLFSDPASLLPAREVIDGIEVVRIAWRGSTRYPVAPSVLAHIADADLVHVHAVDFFFDALSWLRPLHGKPMVATTHGGFFHTKNHAAIKKIWFRTVTRISCLGYRAVICCSASDTETFRQIASGRTVTIENGADLSKFAGRASALPSKRMVTIGRFSMNKRLDNLITTTAALVAGDKDWHLDIIGVASDLSAKDLEALVASAGLSDHVSLHVGLGNEGVAEVIGQASLFVSASDYEGFGLVAIEAMSAGLQPVLNANQAYRQLAARHHEIAITDFSRPETAAEAIIGAYRQVEIKGSDLRNVLMSEAQPYSWTAVAEAYVEAYRQAFPTIAVTAG
jgi:alpha-1,3-mannosyltransferase